MQYFVAPVASSPDTRFIEESDNLSCLFPKIFLSIPKLFQTVPLIFVFVILMFLIVFGTFLP